VLGVASPAVPAPPNPDAILYETCEVRYKPKPVIAFNVSRRYAPANLDAVNPMSGELIYYEVEESWGKTGS